MAGNVETSGLTELVSQLKGPQWRDVNKELRQFSRLIASDMLPEVKRAVAASAAPQAAKMAATTRVHSDRVPVLVVGKVNPKLSGFKRGGASKRHRGSLALGVVAGPAGGKRSTKVNENFYRIPRDPSWGRLGDALSSGGTIIRDAEVAYLRYFIATLKSAGMDAKAG